MACARLAKPTGVFCFRSHPVKVARVGSSMAIPIAECRPCICFSPGMCCPDDRAPWRAHCQFFYPFSMGTCTKTTIRGVVNQQTGRYNSFITQFSAGFQDTGLQMYRWLLFPVL